MPAHNSPKINPFILLMKLSPLLFKTSVALQYHNGILIILTFDERSHGIEPGPFYFEFAISEMLV